MAGDYDSDHFESAEEGGPIPESCSKKVEFVTRTTVPTVLSEAQISSSVKKEDPGRKQKKKVKKRKHTTDTKKHSTVLSPKNALEEDSCSIGLTVSTGDVGIPLEVADNAVVADLPDSSCAAQPACSGASLHTEGSPDDVSHESLATGNIIPGMGDGFTVSADAIIHPLHALDVKDSNVNDENIADRRRQRLEEEKAERKAVAQAWSDVWNAAWGLNDGWEVDENPLEGEEKVDVKQESCSLSHESNDLSAKDEEPQTTSFSMWDWSSVSTLAQQLTSSLHTTGVQLVQEGVSVLETIGKKTMSVIEENDPGFYHTKKILRPPGLTEHPTLSEVIREACNERQHETITESTKRSENISLVSQLESQRGLVHLEAIKLVGEKAETQLHIHLDTRASASVESQMEFIWTILQMEPEDEATDEVKSPECDQPQSSGQFPASLPDGRIRHWESFQQSLTRLNSVYSGERLLKETEAAWGTLAASKEELNPQELFHRAVCSLADLTSAMMEFLHKMAECVLVQTHDPCTDVVDLASEVVRAIRCSMDLSTALCEEYIQLIKTVGKSTNQLTSGALSSTHSYSQLVASLLLESSNAQSYLRDAAQLLVPVFQLAYVESCTTRDDSS